MIKESIYRDGGSITWTSTIGQAIDEFANAELACETTVIYAPGRAWGKSTLFEYLSKMAEGISIEGDVLTVLAVTLAEFGLTDEVKDAVIGDVAKGTGIPDFFPWTSESKDADKMQKAMSEHTDEDWYSKVALTTASKISPFDQSSAILFVIPDYGWYAKNFEKRIKAMVAEDGPMSDHVKETHKVLTWPEFSELLQTGLDKVKDYSTPVIFVPNFGLNFDDVTEVSFLRSLDLTSCSNDKQDKPKEDEQDN